MQTHGVTAAAWPLSRLGDAMAALAAKTGSIVTTADPVNPPSDYSGDAGIAVWMEQHAKLLGCEVESIESNLADLERDLSNTAPALLRVSETLFVAIVRAGRKHLRVLTPDLRLARVSLSAICREIREPVERPKRAQMEQLLETTHSSHGLDAKVIGLLLAEQLSDIRFDQCWRLRSRTGAPLFEWLREPRAPSNLARLLTAHTVQYILWVASWIILGRMCFAGRMDHTGMDRAWLLVWALLLLIVAPFRLFTTWLEGALAIGIGGILKRRLLAGAMRLDPEEVRRHGIGTFLGQVFEAEAFERLALGGGVAGLLAIVELAVAGVVLGRFAVLLLFWCGLTTLAAWRFVRRYQSWTDARMHMTHDLVEALVGHRTRLAQQPEHSWHEGEDRALSHYVESSQRMDRSALWPASVVPRGWLLAALGGLAPAIIAGHSSPARIAVLLGGVLLAYTAFKRLAAAFVDIAGAWAPWKRIRPLFRAASRPERLGAVLLPGQADRTDKILEADRITFRYRTTGNPALQACSLTVSRGERILLEGGSGGGKSTFASLLCGMRQPESGLLLLDGLDRFTLGDRRWRERIASAPQFHESHILTGTLAFNLLMGRAWPPKAQDLRQAETVCRDLGLGELLDRMPSGLQQMVGEGGWQLSHGERSRIYIARALLQDADLVILDESFAALDPDNLRTALECTLERAKTLLVIAHP